MLKIEKVTNGYVMTHSRTSVITGKAISSTYVVLDKLSLHTLIDEVWLDLPNDAALPAPAVNHALMDDDPRSTNDVDVIAR